MDHETETEKEAQVGERNTNISIVLFCFYWNETVLRMRFILIPFFSDLSKEQKCHRITIQKAQICESE